MSWRDTIQTIEEDETPAQPVVLSSDGPSWKDTVRQEDLIVPEEIEEPVAEDPWYYPIADIGKGVAQRGLSYLNPINRMSRRISHGLDDMGFNPMALFVDGAPVFYEPRKFDTEYSTQRDDITRHGTTAELWPTIHGAIVGDEANTDGEHIRRAGGEMVADTLATFGLAWPWAAARTAAVTSGKALPHTGKIGRFFDRYAESMAKSPFKNAYLETSAALSGGMAQEYARQEKLGPLAEFAFGLSGGLGGQFLASGGGTGSIWRGGKSLYNKVSGNEAANAAMSSTGKKILDSWNPEVDVSLDDAMRLEDKIPGLRFSLGEAAGDAAPSFITDEVALNAKSSGSVLDDAIKRKNRALEAVRSFEKSVVPEGFGMGDVQKHAQDVVSSAKASRTAALDDVASAQRDLTDALPQGDRYTSGSRLRTRYDDLKETASSEMSKMAEDLGLNKAPLTGSKKLADRLTGLLDDVNRFEDKKNFPQYVTDVIGGLTTQERINFQDVKTIRENIGSQIREELSRAGGGNARKVSWLMRAQREVDNFLEADLPNDMPDLADKYKTFRDAYKKDYIGRFEKGNAYKVSQGLTGDYVTDNEKVAGLFFKKNDQTAAKQFKETFRDDPEALAAMRDSILDSARAAVIKDGQISDKAIAKWMTEHESVLKEFPDVAKELGDVNSATQALAARSSALAERTKAVDKSFMNTIANGNPDTVLKEAFRDPKKMRELRIAAKDNPAALKRAAWEKVVAAGGKAELPDGAKMLEFIKANEKSLTHVFDQQHLDDLKDIAKAYQKLGHVPKPTGQPINANPYAKVEEKLGQSIPTVMSKLWAVESGRSSPKWAGLNILRNVAYARSNRAATSAVQEIFSNPRQARDMANIIRSNGKNKVAARRLNTWLLASGYEAVNDEPGEVKPEQVEDENE